MLNKADLAKLVNTMLNNKKNETMDEIEKNDIANDTDETVGETADTEETEEIAE